MNRNFSPFKWRHLTPERPKQFRHEFESLREVPDERAVAVEDLTLRRAVAWHASLG